MKEKRFLLWEKWFHLKEKRFHLRENSIQLKEKRLSLKVKRFLLKEKCLRLREKCHFQSVFRFSSAGEIAFLTALRSFGVGLPIPNLSFAHNYCT